MLYKPEMLPVFNTHPVIAYFGMDTIVEVIQWYVSEADIDTDNAPILEKRMLDKIGRAHV